jgi:hypothetical protein
VRFSLRSESPRGGSHSQHEKRDASFAKQQQFATPLRVGRGKLLPAVPHRLLPWFLIPLFFKVQLP